VIATLRPPQYGVFENFYFGDVRKRLAIRSTGETRRRILTAHPVGTPTREPRGGLGGAGFDFADRFPCKCSSNVWSQCFGLESESKWT
jgi:hypothetical protein